MDSALPGQPVRPFAKGLPQSWIEAQWELQREILPRMRAFGTATAIFSDSGNRVPSLLLTRAHVCLIVWQG